MLEDIVAASEKYHNKRAKLRHAFVNKLNKIKARALKRDQVVKETIDDLKEERTNIQIALSRINVEREQS